MALITSIDCVLPRPDIAELASDLKTEFSQRLLGGAPVVPMSSEEVLAFVMAGTVNLMHGFVTQALKENDPRTMCCDNLVTYGAIHGINLRAATRAKGYAALTGTPGAPISRNLRLVGESSREYKLDPAVLFNPTSIDANGGAAVRITAVLPGPEFNLPIGSPLTTTTTFPGINMEATVVGSGLTGGTADETCEELRTRIVNGEMSGVVTTNLAWYLQQSMTFPGITRVCTDECEACCDPSFIRLYPFFEGVYGDIDTPPYGVPPGDVLCIMTDWMFGPVPGKGEGLAPVGMGGVYAVASPVKVNIAISCYDGCIGGEDRVREAMTQYIHDNYCVGSKLCVEQIRAAVLRAVGVDACLAPPAITVERYSRTDCGYIYLNCGDFPVMGDITMTTGLIAGPC